MSNEYQCTSCHGSRKNALGQTCELCGGTGVLQAIEIEHDDIVIEPETNGHPKGDSK
jgi:DnaJ-class molecular chaperone